MCIEIKVQLSDLSETNTCGTTSRWRNKTLLYPRSFPGALLITTYLSLPKKKPLQNHSIICIWHLLAQYYVYHLLCSITSLHQSAFIHSTVDGRLCYSEFLAPWLMLQWNPMSLVHIYLHFYLLYYYSLYNYWIKYAYIPLYSRMLNRVSECL